jgi:Fur family zinc uptake transcriptional regulator
MLEATLKQRLSSASAHCAERGAQLTAQRAEVLELLMRRGGQAKAYDLQDDMQARHGRIAPTTVYRVLDFLQEHKLVHKVDATNTFVVCDHARHEHPALLLICTRCGRIDEVHDIAPVAGLLSKIKQQGMDLQSIEAKCICADCLQAGPG